MAAATASEYIWSQLYSRVSNRLRGRLERGAVPPPATTAKPHAKALLKSAVEYASILRVAKNTMKMMGVRRSRGVIHSLRGSIDRLEIGLGVSLGGSPVKIMASRGKKTEAWVSNPSILSEPSTRNGVRFFSFSSSLKLEVPGNFTVSRLESISVGFYLPEAWLPRVAIFKMEGPVLVEEARLVGRSADKSVSLYELVGRVGGSLDGTTASVSPPLPRACILLGMIEGGKHNDQGFGFLTVHLPHELLLEATCRLRTWRNPPNGRRSKSYGDDSAGDRHGLEQIHVALGLRTAGVPVWEAASAGVAGHLCPRTILTQQEGQCCTGCSRNELVVCLELLKPGGDAAGDLRQAGGSCRLTAGPGLPYSSSGGLSGVIEDVLLADLALSDPNGDSMWAFTMPIVFQTSSASTAAVSPGSIVDMGHNEVWGERRRGVVGECGVGRVVVELSLIESDEDEEPVGRAGRAQQRHRCPAGHAWVVRAARVELELGFVNAWFGTRHGRGQKKIWCGSGVPRKN